MSANSGQLLNPDNESNTSEYSASSSCPSNLPVPILTSTVLVLASDTPFNGLPSISLQWQSGPSRDGVDVDESADPFYDAHGANNALTLHESNPYASFTNTTNQSGSVNEEDEIVMEPEPTKSKKQDKGKGRATDASAQTRHRDIEQDTDEDADGEDDPYEDYYYSAFGKDRMSTKGSKKKNNGVSSIKKVAQSTTPAKRSSIAPESRPVSLVTFTTTLVHPVEEEESDAGSSANGSITPASSPTSSRGLAKKASTESFSSTSTVKPAKRSSQKAAPATTSSVPNTGSPTAPPRPPRSAKRVSFMSTTSNTSATKPAESNRRELSPSMPTPNHSSGFSVSATFASTRGGHNRRSTPFKLPTTATDSTPRAREARNKASDGSGTTQTSSAIPPFSAHRTRYPLDRIDKLPFALCLSKGYSVYRIEECKNYYYLTFKNVKGSWSYRIISKSLEYMWEYE